MTRPFRQHTSTATLRSTMRRIIVGISGSTGAIYGVRLLEVLKEQTEIETHLVISSAARRTIGYELERSFEEVVGLADVVHDERDVSASIASGSFLTDGMIVAPCSMRSLSAIANSLNDNLLTRAADVCLKERRRLVLLARETPLHAGHLRLMLDCTNAGAVILPPCPAFYHRPSTILDVVDQTLGKALDQFGVEAGLFQRWEGLPG